MKSIMVINIASIALGVVASLSFRGPDYPLLSSLWGSVTLAGRTLLDHLGIGLKNKEF